MRSVGQFYLADKCQTSSAPKIYADTRINARAVMALLLSDIACVIICIGTTHAAFAPMESSHRPFLFAAAVSFCVGIATVGLYPGRGIWGPIRLRLRALIAIITFASPAIGGLLLRSPDNVELIATLLTSCAGVFFLSSFSELVIITIFDKFGLWRTKAHIFNNMHLKDRVRRDFSLYPELGLELASDGALNAWSRAHPVTGTAYLLDLESGLPNYSPENGKIGWRYNEFRGYGKFEAAAKRTIDIVGALLILLLLLPFLSIFCAAIYLKDGGPIFFFQNRIGMHGRTIRVWKIRSMYRNAQELLDKLLATNDLARAEWNKHFKLHNDPRVIPGIGRFIRRTSIDEAPQIWNILKGDMSLVGPRPFPEVHLAAFPEEFLALRATVKPGLSGLWQVTMRSDATIAEQELLDRAYIAGSSFWLDLYILFRTPLVLLSGRGAR